MVGDISSLKVADSVPGVQHEDDEQVTIRNIRLQMEQDPTASWLI